MSDIDMRSYAGENLDPAAGDQNPDTNSYLSESQEFSDPEMSQTTSLETSRDPERNPQAEHFKALREEVDRIKQERETERKEYQLQLEMIKANLNQSQHATAREDTSFLAGMQDSDIPSVGDIRKEWQAREQTYQQRIEELQFAQSHPDYSDVLNQYLVPLVKEKPILAQAIERHPTPSAYAYELAKLAQASKAPAPQQPQASEVAQRMVENSRKPGTLSSAGGQSTLSKADYYASMSDAEFVKMASQYLEGI